MKFRFFFRQNVFLKIFFLIWQNEIQNNRFCLCKFHGIKFRSLIGKTNNVRTRLPSRIGLRNFVICVRCRIGLFLTKLGVQAFEWQTN